MKNTRIAIVLGLCLLAASCDKAEPSQSFESLDGKAQAVLELTVNDSYYTKASGVNPSEEKRVNDVQVFLFSSDGTLDAYESVQGTTLQVRCTSGPKKLYVFANAPSLAGYAAESALKSAVTRLSDNYAGAFVMTSGLREVNVSAGNNSMPVTVSRVAARVEIAKITNAMSSAQHQGKTFKVLAAYLTNVAANTSYDLSSLPTDYYNKMGYHSSEVDALVYDNYSGGMQLSWKQSISDPHYLYAYPNPSTDASTNGGSWSPRSTKLVIKASLDGAVYYYPIVIATPLVGNKSYRIEELKITRPGSISEDVPVSIADCSFTLTVSDWSQQSLGTVEI